MASVAVQVAYLLHAVTIATHRRRMFGAGFFNGIRCRGGLAVDLFEACMQFWIRRW
jgi:hypothetical protein